MEPRSTVVVRIFVGDWRVKSGTTANAATIAPSVSQVRPLREAGCPFELLFVGNRFIFQAAAGIIASINLPPPQAQIRRTFPGR